MLELKKTWLLKKLAPLLRNQGLCTGKRSSFEDIRISKKPQNCKSEKKLQKCLSAFIWERSPWHSCSRWASPDNFPMRYFVVLSYPGTKNVAEIMVQGRLVTASIVRRTWHCPHFSGVARMEKPSVMSVKFLFRFQKSSIWKVWEWSWMCWVESLKCKECGILGQGTPKALSGAKLKKKKKKEKTYETKLARP